MPPIRATYTLADVASRRLRPPGERELLDRHGRSCRVIEVQGELELSAYERVAASALDHAEQGSIVVLDLSRVTRVEPGLAPLLADLAEELAVGAARLAIVVGPAGTLLEQAVDGGAEDAPWLADDLDTALECCEDVILAEEGAPSRLVTLDVADHPVSARVPEHERARLLEALEHRWLRPGETLVRAGDASDALYLVTSGRLTVRRSDGSRAVTLSAGMVVGELGAAGRSRRSADVVAETAVECHALRWEELRRLGERRPAVHAAVLEVLLEELARIVQRLERELSSVAPRADVGPRVPASQG